MVTAAYSYQHLSLAKSWTFKELITVLLEVLQPPSRDRLLTVKTSSWQKSLLHSFISGKLLLKE